MKSIIPIEKVSRPPSKKVAVISLFVLAICVVVGAGTAVYFYLQSVN